MCGRVPGAAVPEPKEFSTPEKFPVLTDGPATATSFADEGMIVALMLGTAECCKPKCPMASSENETSVDDN